MMRKRVAILISGRGSNMSALIDAAKAKDYPAKINCVISNIPDAAGLETARANGVETLAIDHRAFGKGKEGRAAFEAALDKALQRFGAEIVCLAGFMRLLTAEFTERWQGKLINIHPSLLPSFKGLNVHERMLEAGVKIAGCTVHFVSAETDAGPIIGQAAVPVAADDTPASLAARILEQEHHLYPECLARIASGRARLIADGVVRLDGAASPGSLFNPTPGTRP
ncbi:MAG: phosphoribosylglycinamide formyltransferase [Parvularculaceae bacterium]